MMSTYNKNDIFYENLSVVNDSFVKLFQRDLSSFYDQGFYILGDEVTRFEEAFSNYLGANYSVGVNSGLDAIILAIESLNLPKNSEIIVPSNTYIATILAIIHCGLKPVLVEPDIATYNIDPSLIEEKVTSKTKAILVVHLYGKSCEMDLIQEIADRKELFLIEDCAQSHGASYKNQKTGTFGIGCFSFYPTKNLGALGDAGAITTDNIEISNSIKCLRNYGSSKKYYFDRIGFNSRLDEIQARFLNIKLEYLDEINEHKRKLANIYYENINSELITLPKKENRHSYDVYHIFCIRTEKRDYLRERLLSKGIHTEIHYPIPPHKQKGYQNIIKGLFPISELIHNTALSLPISYAHTEKQIFYVCETINSILK